MLLATVAVVSAQQGDRELILPDPRACAQRIQHQAAELNGHYYFYSWMHRATASHERDWLDARNICRKHCQDLVSLETPEEAEMIQQAVGGGGPLRNRRGVTNSVQYIWTSGRLCDFDGCDRADLQPKNINGWFWAGSGNRMLATNTRSAQNFPNWSHTGGARRAQPDNREQAEGTGTEACMGILNNFYQDGIKWHDVACHHQKPWVCEDSEELLAYARSIVSYRIP